MMVIYFLDLADDDDSPLLDLGIFEELAVSFPGDSPFLVPVVVSSSA